MGETGHWRRKHILKIQDKVDSDLQTSNTGDRDRRTDEM